MSATVAHFDITPIVRAKAPRRQRCASVPPVAGASQASAAGNATSSVRLTRRGRLLVLFAVLLAVLAMFALVGSPAQSTEVPRHPAAHTVVVQPGQTLWDIASEVAPGTDPRTVVADIIDLNALSDPGAIRVGQPLYVPAR